MRPKLRTVPVLLAILAITGTAWAQQGAAARTADLVAVMDLDPIGAQKTQSSAVTDRLREELLATGRYTLVSRDQMENLLTEQAVQQTGCTSQECAVQVGKMLGVRKIISGRLTRVEDSLWLMSVTMVDVETAKTERAASVTHDGKFITLMTEGVRQVSAKLTAQGGQEPLVRPAAPSLASLSPATVTAPTGSMKIQRIFQLPAIRQGAITAQSPADAMFDLTKDARPLLAELKIEVVRSPPVPFELLARYRDNGWKGMFVKEPDADLLAAIAPQSTADGIYGCLYDYSLLEAGVRCFLYSVGTKKVFLEAKRWDSRSDPTRVPEVMKRQLAALIKTANGAN